MVNVFGLKRGLTLVIPAKRRSLSWGNEETHRIMWFLAGCWGQSGKPDTQETRARRKNRGMGREACGQESKDTQRQ